MAQLPTTTFTSWRDIFLDIDATPESSTTSQPARVVLGSAGCLDPAKKTRNLWMGGNAASRHHDKRAGLMSGSQVMRGQSDEPARFRRHGLWGTDEILDPPAGDRTGSGCRRQRRNSGGGTAMTISLMTNRRQHARSQG